MQTMLTSSLCAAVALCLATGTAHAQRRDRDRDRDDARVSREHLRVPPGLAKKGGLPPGQAKKLYRADDGVDALRDVFGRHGYTVVRTAPRGDRRYLYYRDRNGATRRAIVGPGSIRPSFRNVPASVRREALERLRRSCARAALSRRAASNVTCRR
jgi:hypothetical protein